jgi:hypothetical protein
MPIVKMPADALSRFVASGPVPSPPARRAMPPPARISPPASSASAWRTPLTAPGPVGNLGLSVTPPPPPVPVPVAVAPLPAPVTPEPATRARPHGLLGW